MVEEGGRYIARLADIGVEARIVKMLGLQEEYVQAMFFNGYEMFSKQLIAN